MHYLKAYHIINLEYFAAFMRLKVLVLRYVKNRFVLIKMLYQIVHDFDVLVYGTQ